MLLTMSHFTYSASKETHLPDADELCEWLHGDISRVGVTGVAAAGGLLAAGKGAALISGAMAQAQA